MDKAMHCWPSSWIDAAVKAGLADRVGDRFFVHGGDHMRSALESFANDIIEAVLKDYPNEAALDVE